MKILIKFFIAASMHYSQNLTQSVFKDNVPNNFAIELPRPEPRPNPIAFPTIDMFRHTKTIEYINLIKN